MLDTTPRGFIRFVGGSRHNQHLCVVWERRINLGVKSNSSWDPQVGTLSLEIEYETYELRELWVTTDKRPEPILFHEYHLSGAKPLDFSDDLPQRLIDQADVALRDAFGVVTMQAFLSLQAWRPTFPGKR